MRNKISRISNEEVISAFSTGIADIKMKEKLSMNDELTSVVRLFEIADRCAEAEEGRLFVHNLPEALPPKPKSKDPKRKEAAALAAEPDHKQRRRDRSERDKGGRHRYCILHKKDTHNTEDCWIPVGVAVSSLLGRLWQPLPQDDKGKEDLGAIKGGEATS
jgi:hypothetical protein